MAKLARYLFSQPDLKEEKKQITYVYGGVQLIGMIQVKELHQV
mgnify:FL=1